MALLSDVDWLIILAAGGFLLFGQSSGAFVRQLGRYYGRAMRLKQELLSDVMRAAELPAPAPGQPLSLRAAILGLESRAPAHPIGAAAVAPIPGTSIRSAGETGSETGNTSFGTWSVAVPALSRETEGAR
jgi:hypothetical protein